MNIQNIVLSDEQKKYICSRTLNLGEWLKLALALYIIIFMRPIFYFISIYLIVSFYREFNYARAIKNDAIEITIGEVLDKYEKDPQPHPSSRNRKWMVVMKTPDSQVSEMRVNFHFYQEIEVNDKFFVIKTKSIKRCYKCI